MEGVQCLGFLTHPQELDRLAGDGAHRQRGATTGVSIHLGQDHAGERQRLAKRLRRVGRILTGHGIDHEQGFHRLGDPVQFSDLGHHGLVDRQTARGIHNQHIAETDAGMLHGGASDVHRRLLSLAGKEVDADLRRQGLQLLDRRRTIHVGAHHGDRFLVALLQQACQLGDRGGLARPLQAGHQNDRRRLRGKVQPFVGGAHHRLQLCLHDAQERLTRTQALADLLPQGALLHRLNKILDHGQRNVSLQQRHAHFAQRFLNVVLSQARLASNGAQTLGQAIGQTLEHQRNSRQQAATIANGRTNRYKGAQYTPPGSKPQPCHCHCSPLLPRCSTWQPRGCT